MKLSIALSAMLLSSLPMQAVAVSPTASAAFEHVIAQGLINVSDRPSGQGKAMLTMLKGENDVQMSNFGWRSSQIENLGDKRIAAVYIDLASAIFPDMVIDSDGRGGDDVAKPLSHDWGTTETNPISIDQYQWLWEPARSASGYSPRAAFDPRDLSSVNNLFVNELSDSGLGCEGGFRGELMLFRDFDSGEVYEFSGDMDPNSIAGLTQGTASIHAEWDVGGVSGAELINSVVTVLFGDGTTASGTIASDGSQAGGIAIISDDLVVAPGLSVDGLEAGASGTFTSNPSVIVSGIPGQSVRVSKVSGFDPVDNQEPLAGGLITAEALVTARLESQYPAFPVNNARSWEHLVTVIPSSGSVNIGDGFTYSNDFALGYTAVVIDDAGLPLSTTTNPIHLLSDSNTSISPDSACPSGQKLDGSGFCVRNSCNANIQCPLRSVRKPGRVCYDTFNDCECLAGFSKSGSQCVDTSSSSCPAGQKLDGSASCVAEWCNASFQCPANSSRRPDRQCYDTINDCQCLNGLSMRNNECVDASSSACPSGQKLDGSGYCVRDSCNANISCPANSVRLPNRVCYDTFNDCGCLQGYHKSGSQCIMATGCPSGQKLDPSGYCVRDWCNANYFCPRGRKPGRQCYDTINDCM